MFISSRDGPVTTTVRVYPFQTLCWAVVFAMIGLLAVFSQSFAGLVLGLLALFLAWGMARGAVRQIRRASRTLRS